MTPEREAIFRGGAAAGWTLTEIGRHVGIRKARASVLAKQLGLSFRRGRPRGIVTIDPRSEAMVELYREGFTLQQIGDQYGITRERVRQIMTKRHGIRAKDGGGTVIVDRRRAEREAKRDNRYVARYGCTYDQWKSLRGQRHAFNRQKVNASKRGIGWDLTLWQWWTIWQESGHWHERGRGQGYGMCRNGDSGPYAAGNVFIAPCFINSSEQNRKKSALPIGVKKRGGAFEAYRSIRGQKLYLGRFPTASQASAAYWAAGVIA